MCTYIYIHKHYEYVIIIGERIMNLRMNGLGQRRSKWRRRRGGNDINLVFIYEIPKDQ